MSSEEGNSQLADDPQDLDWVTVETYLSVNDATMARLKLQIAGVDAVLDNEFMVAANPMYGPATGGVKLRVLSTQMDEAREILGQTPAPVCPSCESPDVMLKPLSKGWFLLALTLLTLPLWLVKRPWVCRDCGYVWS